MHISARVQLYLRHNAWFRILYLNGYKNTHITSGHTIPLTTPSNVISEPPFPFKWKTNGDYDDGVEMVQLSVAYGNIGVVMIANETVWMSEIVIIYDDYGKKDTWYEGRVIEIRVR